MLVSSGEPLSEQLLRQLQAALPAQVHILNIYGCAEVSADATCCCLQAPLGKAPPTSHGSSMVIHLHTSAVVRDLQSCRSMSAVRDHHCHALALTIHVSCFAIPQESWQSTPAGMA